MKKLKNAIALAFLCAILAAWLGLSASRERARSMAARTSAPPAAPPPVLPAPPAAESSAAVTATVTATVPRTAIMPWEEKTLAQFQEANSQAMARLLEPSSGLPYSVAAAQGIRLALAELGYDPDQTLAYWLSPEFQQDLAKGDPKEAIAQSRTVANLLSVALGDSVNEEEYAAILALHAPEVRTRATQRRAAP